MKEKIKKFLISILVVFGFFILISIVLVFTKLTSKQKYNQYKVVVKYNGVADTIILKSENQNTLYLNYSPRTRTQSLWCGWKLIRQNADDFQVLEIIEIN